MSELQKAKDTLKRILSPAGMPKPFYQVARGALLEKLLDKKWRVLATDSLVAAALCTRAAAIDAIDEVAPIKPEPKEKKEKRAGGPARGAAGTSPRPVTPPRY